MPITLTQARAIVREHLDAESDDDRWSDAQIDASLSYGLDACQDDYASAGGDRFDRVDMFTTTSAGIVDLSTYGPLQIKSAAILQGNRYWPINSYSVDQRNMNDGSVKQVQLQFVRRCELPTTASHPLVGVGSVAATSWRTFEEWICARAALRCAVKDGEDRPELQRLELEQKSAVMSHIKIPSSQPFPSRKSYISAWYGWTWNADDRTLQVTKRIW